MNRTLFFGSVVFLFSVLVLGPTITEALGVGAEPPDGREAAGARIAEAARAFLAALSEEQSSKALAEFADPLRHDWHFVPRSRKGLPLKELGEGQAAALWKLVDASLSDSGSKKARQVMELEGILRRVEGPGGSIERDPGLYHVLFFGKPDAEKDWGWRLEGHHLSLHFTLKGRRLVSATPSFYGANPALVRDGPEAGLRVLAGVEDAARKLLASLNEPLLEACTGSEDVPEDVPETGKTRYAGPFPAGVALADLSEGQRGLFRDLVREYTANLPPDYAREFERSIRQENPGDVHFAWRGERKPFQPHSYMAHGKTFVINYSNVQGGGTHVHSALRERQNDFGPDAK